MIWLLAEGTTRSSAPATRSPAGTPRPTAAIGAALVVPERRGARHRRRAPRRARAVGGRARRDRARRPRLRGRRRQPGLGGSARLRGGRAQLADGARPDDDRGSAVDAAARDRDRHVGGAPRAGRGALGGRARGGARHPRRGGDRRRHARRVARARHARQRRPARGRLRRARGRRGRSATPSSPSRRRRPSARSTTSPASSAPTAAAGSRRSLKAAQIAWAKENGYRSAPDLERGPERADPAPEREARLRARAGRRDRAPNARRYLSIASSIARRPTTRARCARNSALAAVSVGGSVPSAICAAGSSSPGDERLLRRGRTQRRRAHVRERDPGVLDVAVVAPHERRDADRRPVLGAPRELEIRPAGPGAELRHPDLRQHLPRPARRVEDALEELRRGNRPLAGRAGDRRARPRARGSRPGSPRRDRSGRASRRSCRGGAPADRRSARRCARRSGSAPGSAGRPGAPCTASAPRSRATRPCRARTRAREAGRCRRAATAGRSGA